MMCVHKHGLKTAWAVSIGMALFAGSPPVNAERWVVIDAENTPLSPGALVENGQPVTLAEGARLTLLTEEGQTLKLTGPYSDVPGGSAAASTAGKNLTIIAQLLQGHQQVNTVLGGSRGESWPEPPDVPSAADLIDADHSGEHCLSRDPVVLWRQNPAALETVTLTDAEGRPLAHWMWPASAAQLAVPGHLFANGQHYRLLRGVRLVELYVHKTPPLLNQPAALAAWMADHGCKTQALILLKGL